MSMDKSVRKFVWTYLKNHIEEQLDNDFDIDAYMMSRCLELVNENLLSKKKSIDPTGAELINKLKYFYEVNQIELARTLKVTQATVSKWRNLEMPVPINRIKQLEDLLDKRHKEVA